MKTRLSEAIEKEIDLLVATTQSLSRDAAKSDSALGADRIEEQSSAIARGKQLIRRLYGENSAYESSLSRVLGQTKTFSMMHSNYFEHVSELAGLFKAIQHEVKSGLLTDIRYLIRAEVFADFLEMTEHLLAEDYKDAAAVILGAVLEDSLRKLAVRNNVPIVKADGKELTIDPLNIELCKANVYDGLVKKQVTTWAHLRNDAAHGQFAKYDKTQVQQMLWFVQKFCGDYLK